MSVYTIVHKIVCVRVWGCVCVARVYMYKWVWVFIYVHVCVCVYVQVRVYLSGEFHVELIMNFQRNVEVFLEGGGIWSIFNEEKKTGYQLKLDPGAILVLPSIFTRCSSATTGALVINLYWSVITAAITVKACFYNVSLYLLFLFNTRLRDK